MRRGDLRRLIGRVGIASDKFFCGGSLETGSKHSAVFTRFFAILGVCLSSNVRSIFIFIFIFAFTDGFVLLHSRCHSNLFFYSLFTVPYKAFVVMRVHLISLWSAPLAFYELGCMHVMSFGKLADV